VVPRNSSLRVKSIGRDDVCELNLRTYGWATKTIYGRTQEVVQWIRRQAKQDPSLLIRPRTPKPVIMEPADPNDPNVGIEHTKIGWPRGLWIRGDDGRQQFVAYTLLDPGDPRATSAAIGAEEISTRVMASAEGGAGEVKSGSVSPDEVASAE
jgi:hypothetical protein